MLLRSLRTEHSTFGSAITVSYYCCNVSEQHGIRVLRTHSQHLWMLFWSIFIVFYEYIDILVATLWERSIHHFWAAQPPLFIEVFRSLTTWHFHRYALRTRHSTFRSAITVSHYFCFWTACCQGIKDTFATFVIAVVEVYGDFATL